MISNRLRLLGGALLALAVIALGGLTALASGGAPTAETEHHSGLGRTSVTLNASVNPNGTEVTECDFEYGTSEGSLTSTAPWKEAGISRRTWERRRKQTARGAVGED